MPLQNSIKKAFTLVELMVALAIVAVLASQALPAYQDYLRRIRVVEAVTLAKNLQTKIIDNATNGLPWTNNVTTLYTKYAQIWPNSGNGHVDITFYPQYFDGNTYHLDMWPAQTDSNGVSTPLTSGVIPQGQVTWKCVYDASSSSSTYLRLPLRYTPASCQ